MSDNTKTSLLYNLGSAVVAFFLWGGWAYFINKSIVSALTQGMASFIITLILVHVVTRIFRILSAKIGGLLQLLLPALITVSFTGTGLYFIHRVAGTVYIAQTIAPALFVAFVFCGYTAHKLQGKYNV